MSWETWAQIMLLMFWAALLIDIVHTGMTKRKAKEVNKDG